MDHHSYRKKFYEWVMLFVIWIVRCCSIVLLIGIMRCEKLDEVFAILIASGILVWISNQLKDSVSDYQNYGKRLNKRLRPFVRGLLSCCSVLMIVGLNGCETLADFFIGVFMSVFLMWIAYRLKKVPVIFEEGIKLFKKSFISYREIDSVQLGVKSRRYRGRLVYDYSISFVKENKDVFEFKPWSEQDGIIKLLKKLSSTNSKIIESLLSTGHGSSLEVDFYQRVKEQLNENQLTVAHQTPKKITMMSSISDLGKSVLSQKTKLDLIISGCIIVASPLVFLFIGITFFLKTSPSSNEFSQLVSVLPSVLSVIGFSASREYFRDNLISFLNNRKFYERGVRTKYGLIAYDDIDEINVVIRSCKGRINCVTFYFKCEEYVVKRLICYSEEQVMREWGPIVTNNPDLGERLTLFEDKRKTSRKFFDKLKEIK